MRLIRRKLDSSSPSQEDRMPALLHAYRLLSEEARRARAKAPAQRPAAKG